MLIRTRGTREARSGMEAIPPCPCCFGQESFVERVLSGFSSTNDNTGGMMM